MSVTRGLDTRTPVATVRGPLRFQTKTEHDKSTLEMIKYFAHVQSFVGSEKHKSVTKHLRGHF